eukprot:scaffold5332_cov69-Cyclotella_meneghiniana.AAC.1
MASPTTAQGGDATAAALQSVAGIFTDYTRDQKRAWKEQTKAKSEAACWTNTTWRHSRALRGSVTPGKYRGFMPCSRQRTIVQPTEQ